MKASRKIVLIPTYNEKENIQKMLPLLLGQYPDIEIWVIDDNSPDGTGEAVRGILSSEKRVTLISRKEKNGLGEAYKHALKLIQLMPDVEAVATMDADGSHDPSRLAYLFEALKTHDLAIGSRYTEGGGGMKDMGVYRDFLSRGGNLYARLIIGFSIRDSTAGFVAFRKSALELIDLSSIASSGYSYQIEFKNKFLEAGRTHIEVPITFLDREIGVSKMSGNIIREAIMVPWRIIGRRMMSRSGLVWALRRFGIAAFFVFAIFFSLYKLTESPPVWYDEGIYTQLGMNVASYGVSGLRLNPTEITQVPQLTVGYPLIYPLALVFEMFGNRILQARLLMVFFLIAFVIAAYALVRKIYGPSLALMSLGLLVTFGPLYGNGKSVLGEVPGLLFVALSILCFEARKTAGRYSSVYLICSGLATGLAAATKPYFLVFPAAIAIAVVIEYFRKSIRAKDICILGAATIIPIVIWLALQFSGSQAGDMLSRYANPYQYGSLTSVVSDNIRGLVAGIGPIYLLVMMGVWTISFWITLRKRQRISMMEIAAYSFVAMSFVAFLRTSGMYRYIFPAQAISILFFAPAAARIIGLSGDCLAMFFRRYKLLHVAVFLMTAFGVYQVCFDSWVAQAYSSNKTAEWEAHFASMSSSTIEFFYDTPEVAIFKKDPNYFQFIEPGPGLNIGQAGLEALNKGLPDEVVITTAKLSNLSTSTMSHYTHSRRFYKYTILRH